MKNTAKSIVISIFALGALFMFLSSNSVSTISEAAFSDAAAALATSTPTAAATGKPAAAVPANAAANANTVKPAETGGKSMKETFALAQDSVDEIYGVAAFINKFQAFENYSPDGISVSGCVE